jgi:hypothetical protein
VMWSISVAVDFACYQAERYHQQTTIITTNLGYDEWPRLSGHRAMVPALLSRLRHYHHTLLTQETQFGGYEDKELRSVCKRSPS